MPRKKWQTQPSKEPVTRHIEELQPVFERTRSASRRGRAAATGLPIPGPGCHGAGRPLPRDPLDVLAADSLWPRLAISPRLRSPATPAWPIASGDRELAARRNQRDVAKSAERSTLPADAIGRRRKL